jgi:hypothetical protein
MAWRANACAIAAPSSGGTGANVGIESVIVIPSCRGWFVPANASVQRTFAYRTPVQQ